MSEPNDLTGSITPPEHAVLPYAGTSGYAAGVATSEERARRDDADGTTSKRQSEVLARLAFYAEDGQTWRELATGRGWHHGQASGVLSVLHKAGKISRLTERRDRCFVYVLPEHVNGRDTQEQGRPKQPDDGLAVALVQAEATILRVEAVLQTYRDDDMLLVPISEISRAIAGE